MAGFNFAEDKTKHPGMFYLQVVFLNHALEDREVRICRRAVKACGASANTRARGRLRRKPSRRVNTARMELNTHVA